MKQQTTTGEWGSGNIICRHCNSELETVWTRGTVRGVPAIPTAAAPFCYCEDAIAERNEARKSRMNQRRFIR